MDPTLKLFSPLAAAAENNRADPGAKALSNRERESIVTGQFFKKELASFFPSLW
jgi:hypothetical protein